MSSRVFPRDAGVETTPVPWKRVQSEEVSRPKQVESRPDMGPTREECEQREFNARAAGYREGEAAGRNQAAAELKLVLEGLARAVDEMSRLRARFRREAEDDMVRLAMAIARRVLRRELVVDPDALHGLILGALEKLQSQEISRVRVHPSHAPQVSGYLRQALNNSAVEVVADPGKELGTALFETSRGNLDAGVDSQLQEIERGLIDRLPKQP